MMSAFNKKLILDCLRDDADEAVICDGFELQLNNLMDRRVSLSDDQSVQDHADSCVECRQVLQRYQQLELLFGGVQGEQRVGLRDDSVKVSGVAGSRMGLMQSLGWAKLPLTLAVLVGLVVVFVGQNFDGQGAGGAAPSVAVVEMDSQMLTGGDAAASDLFWMTESPVSQLKKWVDSGSELLAAGEEQAAVIRELSNVRLDLEGLESQLESLQPMLTYSGRIPALSPMQGTVCFTLGWLKKGKTADSQESAVEVGQYQLQEIRCIG